MTETASPQPTYRSIPDMFLHRVRTSPDARAFAI